MDEGGQNGVNASMDGNGSGTLYLNRLQMAERLGVSPQRLRGYMERNEAYFGGVKSGKGHVYPVESEALFREALDMTPASFAARVKRAKQEAQEGSGADLPAVAGGRNGVNASMNGNAALTRSDTLLLGEALQEVVEALREARDQLAQTADRALPPPPQDALLTQEEAAARLLCRPRSVSRYVKAFRPGVWRESDILRYVQTGRRQSGQE